MADMNTKAMYKLSYGLYVCTAKMYQKQNGCIINTAVQAAGEPNIITISLSKADLTHDMIYETGACNISVISTDASFELFRHFGFQSGTDTDKFGAGFPSSSYGIAENGIPYITRGTNAWFSLSVKEKTDLGSHTLFICEPVSMAVLSDMPSCTYAYYQENIKPKPPARASGTDGKTVWRCTVCGYEFEGEELPDGFVCPVCKHGSTDFEKI